MKTSGWLIALMLTSVVWFMACGGDGPSGSAISCDAAQGNLGDLVLNLSFEHDPEFKRGEPIIVHVMVTNCTDAPVKRGYRDAQRYEVEVRAYGGIDPDPIWTWSHGMTFEQVKGEETFAPRETKTYAVVWDQMSNDGTRVDPGHYVLGALTTCDAPPACTSALGTVVEIKG